ncbi:hypothetical protein GCM10007898_18050 [Dyella flagellata]|uniref:Uncharacterized protein n=1 Tax=Dyella flagellata TaxID=1867833 RepID=A0ABQ5XC90_9GAMM|nr:hypothetical protein GCM10007898_18050 [Dyella flagellata]
MIAGFTAYTMVPDAVLDPALCDEAVPPEVLHPVNTMLAITIAAKNVFIDPPASSFLFELGDSSVHGSGSLHDPT